MIVSSRVMICCGSALDVTMVLNIISHCLRHARWVASNDFKYILAQRDASHGSSHGSHHFVFIYAPEGCRHGTHTNGTAYIRGTYYLSQSLSQSVILCPAREEKINLCAPTRPSMPRGVCLHQPAVGSASYEHTASKLLPSASCVATVVEHVVGAVAAAGPCAAEQSRASLRLRDAPSTSHGRPIVLLRGRSPATGHQHRASAPNSGKGSCEPRQYTHTGPSAVLRGTGASSPLSRARCCTDRASASIALVLPRVARHAAAFRSASSARNASGLRP